MPSRVVVAMHVRSPSVEDFHTPFNGWHDDDDAIVLCGGNNDSRSSKTTKRAASIIVIAMNPTHTKYVLFRFCRLLSSHSVPLYFKKYGLYQPFNFRFGSCASQ